WGSRAWTRRCGRPRRRWRWPRPRASCSTGGCCGWRAGRRGGRCRSPRTPRPPCSSRTRPTTPTRPGGWRRGWGAGWAGGGRRRGVWGGGAVGPAELDALRQVRDGALPGLYLLRGAVQPVTVVEDVAVPPEQLAAYLPRVQDVLRRLEVTAAFLVGPGSGL